MAIRLGPNDKLVIRGAPELTDDKRLRKSVVAYIKRRLKELEAAEESTGRQWYERRIEARGRVRELRQLRLHLAKLERRQ